VRVPRQTPLELGAPGAGPESLLPAVLAFDDCDNTRDVIDALALAPFVSGQQPYARNKDLANVRDDATLLPPAARVLRESVWPNLRARLAAGSGWTVRSVHWLSTRTATVVVTATTAELGTRIMAEATDGMTEQPPGDEAVVMGFWHLSAGGPRRHSRAITSASWTDVRANYARGAATQLDRLIGIGRDSVLGRLLLVYGRPGTGKTTALRMLAREWRDWCRFDCVLDPDALFGNPAYLMEVAVDRADDSDDDDKWRMLLLEDCDELIRGEAKQHTGQALSRLLNLTDGLLGQGRKVLVAITTNEDMARLHPAVIRPGRCLAHIEVPALSFGEASTWLGTSAGVPVGGATLAELYALRDGHQPAIDREPVLDGQYL
jgi:Domain of unknown function (DUF5925)/ATPase family associated with various cellular activities (AAA)